MKSWEALLSVTRRASSHLTLPASVVAALRADRDRPAFERHAVGARWQETGFVFTTTNSTPLNPRNVPRVWHGLLAAAGLPRRPFHVTRHIAVSLLIAECIPLKINQKVVGHSLLSMTADIYTSFHRRLRKPLTLWIVPLGSPTGVCPPTNGRGARRGVVSES